MTVNLSSHSIAKNFISLVFGQYGGMICNIGFSIWLTRLLSPKDFGVIAISLFYFNFFNWITEWGWEQAFMAHKEIELNRAASTHLLLRFVLGAVPLIVFSSGYWFFKGIISSEIYSVVLLLSGIYWIEKIGFTYKTILEREYKLRNIAVVEFLTVVSSYICAIGAALSGFGIYSLIIQRFIEKGVISIGYLAVSPWKIGFNFDFGIIKIFFKSFGVGSWLGGVFGLAIYDFMPFLIGYFSDTHQAGLYAKAFSIATFPVMLTGIFSRMTIPLYTLYQFKPDDIKSIFVKSQAIKFIVLVPTQLVLGIFADYWIPILLGDKWSVMVPIYRVMTIYGLFRSFFDDVPNVITYGYKNIWALTKSQVIQSVFILILGPLLVWWSKAIGGAIAISAMMIFATVLFWRDVFNKINCGVQDFWDFFVCMPSWIRRQIVLVYNSMYKKDEAH